MNKFGAASFTIILLCTSLTVQGASNGNPTPGSPHDTLNFHLKKSASGVVGCSGNGHAAFVRYDDTTGMVLPTDIYISMVDWVQLDNDGDGFFEGIGKAFKALGVIVLIVLAGYGIAKIIKDGV